jgi:hypothetical protein
VEVMANWPGLVKSDDPDFNDPRFQRRVEALWRPIPIVENVHEARLECGHEPLLLGDNPPRVGTKCFCGDCRDLQKEVKP